MSATAEYEAIILRAYDHLTANPFAKVREISDAIGETEGRLRWAIHRCWKMNYAQFQKHVHNAEYQRIPEDAA